MTTVNLSHFIAGQCNDTFQMLFNSQLALSVLPKPAAYIYSAHTEIKFYICSHNPQSELTHIFSILKSSYLLKVFLFSQLYPTSNINMKSYGTTTFKNLPSILWVPHSRRLGGFFHGQVVKLFCPSFQLSIQMSQELLRSGISDNKDGEKLLKLHCFKLHYVGQLLSVFHEKYSPLFLQVVGYYFQHK